MSAFDVSTLKKNINHLDEEETPREDSDDVQSDRNENVTVVNHSQTIQREVQPTTGLVKPASSSRSTRPEIAPRKDALASNINDAWKLLRINGKKMKITNLVLHKAVIHNNLQRSLVEKVEKHRQARRIGRKRVSLEDISKEDGVKDPKLAKFDFEEIVKEIAKRLAMYTFSPTNEQSIFEKLLTTVDVLEQDNKKGIHIGSFVDKVLSDVVAGTCPTKPESIKPLSTIISSSVSTSDTVDCDADDEFDDAELSDTSF